LQIEGGDGWKRALTFLDLTNLTPFREKPESKQKPKFKERRPITWKEKEELW
jgi:hypothetical protein